MKKFKTAEHLTPDLTSKKKGALWCPYCGEWQVFSVLPDRKSNYDRCNGCTISNEDYYVKHVNHLWGMPEAIVKAKAKSLKDKKGK
jgi:Pyruvate/2-oxoacid:ferredoxin oxidoreductase delta subunit